MAQRRILIAGFGTMAGAMLEGWLAAGLPPGDFAVYNPRPKPVPAGVAFSTSIPQAAPEVLVMGFKPQMLGEAAAMIAPLAGPETIVVSILAGAELATLARHFPQARAIVRFMPNLAVAIGKSPNLLVARGLDDAQRSEVTALAEALGSAEWFADERLFELATALAGSGPAFLYRFIAALAEAAGSLGLDPAQAERLAVRMIEGAAALAAASPHSPAELARRVASPGGMTQKGLDALDADRALVQLVEDCLRATRDRGAELAAAARERG